MRVFERFLSNIFGTKVAKTRITPLTTKILFVFGFFLLVSNFTTNYFNLTYNQVVMTRLLEKLLVKDLKEIYTFGNNQYQIFGFSGNREEAMSELTAMGGSLLENTNSLVLGIDKEGMVVFSSLGPGVKLTEKFVETPEALAKTLPFEIDEEGKVKNGDGICLFNYSGKEFFGVYRYHTKWDFFLLRAEELNEFKSGSRQIFKNIAIIILVLTLVCSVLGFVVMREILRFVGYITNSLMRMKQTQKIGRIDLSKAPLDQITYLGLSFNSLSDAIDNLTNIFKKFVSDDVVEKIYREKDIRLEGNSRELSILFTDIKGFTFITETLGTDIIELLNIHYDKAISNIIEEKGIIGSIIGDALLAVYGTFDKNPGNKSYQALLSSYKIVMAANNFREKIRERRKEIIAKNKVFDEEHEKIYQAVLIDVGIGLDGGNVFYGNIGSSAQMTNTVIGDRVNSAARLEGLTRVYKVPVICSDYIKDDIQKNVPRSGVLFTEIDLVMVKGKTEGRKVYWPILKENVTPKLKEEIQLFSSALKKYYKGEWAAARKIFEVVNLPLVEIFLERTKRTCPSDWNGVWVMKEK